MRLGDGRVAANLPLPNMSHHLLTFKKMKNLILLFCLLPQLALAQKTSQSRQSYLAHIAAANAAFRLHEPAEAKRWLAAAPEKHRGWEWHFLKNQSEQSLQIIELAGEKPTNLALSPDGSTAVLTFANGEVKVCESKNFQQKQSLAGHRATVYDATFLTGGGSIFTCSRDSTIRRFDAADGEQEWEIKSGGQGLAVLDCSPDDSKIAFASWFRERGRGVVGFVRLLDAATGAEIWKTEFGVKPILALKFSPDGACLAAGNWDAEVGIFNLKNLDEKPVVVGFRDRRDYSAVDDLDFSPDGKLLVAASKSGEPRVWEAATGRQIFELRGHRQAVGAVAFSRDGQHIFTAGDEGVLMTWDAATGDLLARQFGHAGRITRICPTADGREILTLADDRTIRRWSAAGGLDFDLPAAARSRDIWAFDGSADGKFLAMGAAEGQVAVWDLKNSSLKKIVKCLPDALNSLAFSPDGSQFVGANWSNEVKIWDEATGEIIQNLEGFDGGSSGVAWSPDGKFVAAASRKPFVFVWETASGKLLQKLDRVGGSYFVKFSPDGKTLAAAGNDGKIVVWETRNFQKIREWQAHDGSIYSLAFSPDGKKIVSAGEDKTARIWDFQKGKILQTLGGHAQRVWSVAWSPDGSRVATGSADLTTCFWDSATGERVLALPTSHAVYNLFFSPDGGSLFANPSGARPLVWRTR